MKHVKVVADTPGEWLFHYTGIDKAKLILDELRMKLSPFTTMRDPREFKAWAPPAVGFTGNATDEDVERAWAEASARLDAVRRRFKLLSLTQDDLTIPGTYGRGYARSRLWEQYAQVGQGVCLAFAKDAAIAEIPPQLQAFGPEYHGGVIYRDQRLHDNVLIDLTAAVEGRWSDIEGNLDVEGALLHEEHGMGERKRVPIRGVD